MSPLLLLFAHPAIWSTDVIAGAPSWTMRTSGKWHHINTGLPTSSHQNFYMRKNLSSIGYIIIFLTSVVTHSETKS